ncbi:MAG: trigger factor [Bacteroides sp.]|nr:trigger factor [Roseburia sp.]MCM1345774.1 trigger factor [Bacteroides sp.]MCM1420131.1 trigger factor [Bacteroides sp.]
MNISLQNTDKLNAVITAVVEPADYEGNVAKAIKDFSKKANMPGFRPGKVPAALIKKQYGKSIIVEEVNKILQSSLYNYIRENKINMLGEPLPVVENDGINIAEGETFTFKFEIALAPEFEVSLTNEDKLNYYNVEVPEDMVENQIMMYRQRGGSYDKVESYQDNDMVKGVITELDEAGSAKEEGLTVEAVVMLPKYFKNDDQKALFAEAKVGDIIKFNPSVAYDNSEVEISSLLKIEKEKAADYKGDFNFQINEITRFVPGELNQELFDAVYPGGEVKSEEDFRTKIKEAIVNQFKKDSDYKFILDLKNYLKEKVGALEFPDEKLKRIITANAKDPSKVDENYAKNIEELTWHLIKEKLVEQNGIKVDDNDVIEMGKEVTRMQFAQYGMLNIPEEYLDNSVKEMMKKRETIDNLIDRCIEVKLGAALKEKVTLEEKNVTVEEFNKMFE